MVKSILVVCTGNLCRSPIGERLLRQCLPEIQIASAGIHGVAGQSADERALAVATAHGLSLEDHVSRKLTSQMLHSSDLILAMEAEHIRYITSVAPEVRGKTLLFGQWHSFQDIPDPYCQGERTFEQVFHLLSEASQEWVKRIRA